MPHVRITKDLTIAVARMDLKETEETAQEKFKMSNEGIIPTYAERFVMKALSAY